MWDCLHKFGEIPIHSDFFFFNLKANCCKVLYLMSAFKTTQSFLQEGRMFTFLAGWASKSTNTWKPVSGLILLVFPIFWNSDRLIVIFIRVFNGWDPFSPIVPGSLLATVSLEQYGSNLGYLSGAQRAIPNNFALHKIWWPWNIAGTLSERWNSLKDNKTSPVSWNEIILTWWGSLLSYKTRLFRVSLPIDKTHFTRQCHYIFFSKLSF